MKRIVLLTFVALLLRLGTLAQTPFFNEDFNSPQGWQLDANWIIENGLLQFYWSPTITNFDLSALSSEIVLPATVQQIIVNQYLNVFSTSTPPEVAEIYIETAGEETLLWNHTLDNGNWGVPGGQEIALDISAFGGETVQIRFRTHGPTTYNWNDWNIYDFTMTSLLDNDLAILGFDGSTVLNVEEQGVWDVEIRNLGSIPQSNFLLKLFNWKNGEMIDMIEVTDEIQPQQSKFYGFEWIPEYSQNTAIHGIIEFENDEFLGNNTSKSFFVRVKPDIEFSVLVWDNDNDIQTITDPETGDAITPATGLTRALDAAGFTYDFNTFLPSNYLDYDIIFATLGCYCLS